LFSHLKVEQHEPHGETISRLKYWVSEPKPLGSVLLAVCSYW